MFKSICFRGLTIYATLSTYRVIDTIFFIVFIIHIFCAICSEFFHNFFFKFFVCFCTTAFIMLCHRNCFSFVQYNNTFDSPDAVPWDRTMQISEIMTTQEPSFQLKVWRFSV